LSSGQAPSPRSGMFIPRGDGFLSGSFQMFAAGAIDYSKKSLERDSAFIEKLPRAKSLGSGIQIESDATALTQSSRHILRK